MCWQMPAPGKVPTPRKVPTRAGMCQHIKVPAQVSTHLRADTCRHVLTYECYLEAGMCWHVSAPRRCRHLRRCRPNKKVHKISIRDVGKCRHLDVSAPSQVSTLFQVLTHASISQFANKKVHMISMTDVGMCRHVSAPWRVGTCRHIPRCRQLFRCWHMSVHISI